MKTKANIRTMQSRPERVPYIAATVFGMGIGALINYFNPKPVETFESPAALEAIVANPPAERIEIPYPAEIGEVIDRVYTERQAELPSYMTREWFFGLIQKESSYIPYALGAQGDSGLCQLRRPAMQDIGRERVYDSPSIFDSYTNADSCLHYLKKLDGYANQDKFWESRSDASKRDIIAAGFNIGPTQLRELDWNLDRVAPSVRDYVSDINENANNIAWAEYLAE